MKSSLAGCLGFCSTLLCWTAATFAASHYAAWSNGPSASDDYFPIAVWLQSPRNAPKYKAIGVNLYVALSGRTT